MLKISMATTGLYQQQKTQQKQYSLYILQNRLSHVFFSKQGLAVISSFTSLINPNKLLKQKLRICCFPLVSSPPFVAHRGKPCLSWPTCWWHTFRPDLAPQVTRNHQRPTAPTPSGTTTTRRVSPAPSSQLRCWSPRCKVAVHPGQKKTQATCQPPKGG